MSILRYARIEGLWDEKKIEVELDPKVNFLIGANGSGKTTLLNLIASALSSDYDSLARTSFSRILCMLRSPKGEPDIEVLVQRPAEELPRLTFHYHVMQGSKQLADFELFPATPRYLLPTSLRHRSRQATEYYDSDTSPLNEFVRVKWLTVHRAPAKGKNEERSASDSSVDRKLTTLSNQLVRYFSKLAALRETETGRFLRQMLGVSVFSASEFDPFSVGKDVDLPALRESIETLLDTFLGGSGAKKARERLEAHFQLAARALEDKTSYDLDELVALAAVLPMKKIVEGWNSTQAKQEAIAKPRTEFIEVINDMYKNKKLTLNQKNELEVDLPNGKHLPLSELSSGEKQLLILFSEALLQEKSEFIYIADEPELSLHVTWQEQLTRNLLKVNPNAQVIFATHSPDIVSEFGDHTIDMEKLIS